MPRAVQPEKVDERPVPTWVPLVPWVLIVGCMAAWTSREVIRQAAGPAVPLDDSYIHFQYARAFARFAPFEYTPGAAATPGATSVLWPLALSPWVALGFDGPQLVYVAWALGWLSLAGLAHETRLLARGLVSKAAAWAAGASIPAFGGLVWFAASGMEVVPFAWLMTFAARKVAEWWERRAGDRRAPFALIAIAWFAPLCRPEGAVASLGVAMTLAARRPSRPGAALVAGLGVAAPNLVYAAATGTPWSSTSLAKWLPMSPYMSAGELLSIVGANLRLLFTNVLGGGPWTWIFLPKGAHVVIGAALLALPVAGLITGRRARSIAVLALALCAVLPTTYETFLVNRLRYVWPFAAGWLVAVAVLADLVGRGLGSRWRHGRHAGPALATAAVAVLAERIPDSVRDLSTSAAAVTDQQVSLGRWVAESLPEEARVGLNDTGAIAYFGGRRTFDVVGLTTRGEARYWSAGAGARFEHYEQLRPEQRPTHFVVYRRWFAIDSLLGPMLTERTVHASILGGDTMSAHLADWSVAGSASDPGRPIPGARVDALDVADLESEARHGYELLDATKERCLVVSAGDRADGARAERHVDRFTLRAGARLVARLGASTRTRLDVRVDGRDVAHLEVPASSWVERVVPLSGVPTEGPAHFEIRARDGRFTAMHYWMYR